MSTEDSERYRLNQLRISIRHHTEDAAALFQQLPETEHGLHLVNAVVAWASTRETRYGGRSAHEAVRKVHQFLNRGYTDVVDADLKGYFDTIPHHAQRC
jgi:hypothetical protein